MEHCRAAERALVTSLILGDADACDFTGRLRASDFADPAAGLLFEVALASGRAAGEIGRELPVLLRREGVLRSDGYPLSELLSWMPQVPTPAHPNAWAALVVAGSLARQVQASGIRLVQCAERAHECGGGPGRVLAMAEAQRAAVRSALRRWHELPASWRDSLPPGVVAAGSVLPSSTVPPQAHGGASAGRERELLAGLAAAPKLLGRIPWLRESDFSEPSCGVVFGALRRLHEFGHPVDAITLALATSRTEPVPGIESPAAVAAALRPEQAFPSAVPFLARQVLERGIVTAAKQVGEDLVGLARGSSAEAGLGAPMLAAATERLEQLRPHHLRLHNAKQASASVRSSVRSPVGITPATCQLPAPARPDVLDRSAG